MAFSRTAHLTKAAKFAKIFTSGAQLESGWCSDPQGAQTSHPSFCGASTIMARALLNFAFFHVPLTLARQQNLPKKFTSIVENRWRSGPQVAQLYCSGRTIMARALLIFGFFTQRSPYHRIKIWPKNSRQGAAPESLVRRSTSHPAVLLC